jgi:hypothetical protein
MVSNWSNDDQAHHLAAVWDDGKISVYFDGKLVGEGGQPGSGELISKLGDLRFGEDYPPTSMVNEPFLGSVGEILVLKQALTTNQILALAQQGANASLDVASARGTLYTMESEDQPLADELVADGRQDGIPSTVTERTTTVRGATELLLNFSTSAAGSIRVELQDSSGQPIPGFTLTECDEIFGDSVCMPVSWNKSTEVSSLAAHPIRVRYVLKDADLYSMQFQVRGDTEE